MPTRWLRPRPTARAGTPGRGRALALAVFVLSAAAATRGVAQVAHVAPAPPATAVAPATLVVRRAAGDSLVLDAAALAALPHREVRASEHGHAGVFRGVPLGDVLRAAGVRLDSLRGPALGDVLVAVAADGYRAVFAMGELAPDLGGREVLVVDRRDDQPLGATEGPLRLVVPGDARPARWVRQLRALSVRHAPD